MDTEIKLMNLLINEESDISNVEGFEDVGLTFRRPPLAEKHKGRAWIFKKIKEYGYDETDTDNASVKMLQYWGQLNASVSGVYVDGKPYETAPGYASPFESFVVEEIYNKRELDEERFIYAAVILWGRWLEDTEVDEAEVKNS